jgi:ketosteroid isomerase-like protein
VRASASTNSARLLSLLVVIASIGTACTNPQTASDGETATRRSSLEASSDAFHQALRTDNVDTLFAYVSDDVVIMPPGEPALRGKAAMRQWYEGFLSQYRTSSLTLANRELFVGDEWAVETGTYEWTLVPAAGGDPLPDGGNYMQVWKAQPDGQWLFHREVWNSSGPASN